MNFSGGSLVRFDHVSRYFNKTPAVNSLSFGLERNRSLAILGPNGAGKTTIIRMLLGVLSPSAGSIFLWGEPAASSAFGAKKRIGVVIEEQTFFLDMSAWEYLHLFGELYEVENISDKAEALLSYMELSGSKHKRLKEFSTGMKKKLNIIQAVLHGPEILILDEPFSGLDPRGIELSIKLFREMKKKGSTLIVCSHILSEIDSLVEDLLIIDRGNVKAWGNKKRLWEEYIGKNKMYLRLAEPNEAGINALGQLPLISGYKTRKGLSYVFDIDTDENVKVITAREIIKNKLLVSHLRYPEPSVKAIYARVMNRDEEDTGTNGAEES